MYGFFPPQLIILQLLAAFMSNTSFRVLSFRLTCIYPWIASLDPEWPHCSHLHETILFNYQALESIAFFKYVHLRRQSLDQR